MELATIRLMGMTCENCAESIAAALTATAGVEKATVSFSGHRAQVGFDGAVTSLDALKQVIRDKGYDIQPAHGEEGNCCGSCGG